MVVLTSYAMPNSILKRQWTLATLHGLLFFILVISFDVSVCGAKWNDDVQRPSTTSSLWGVTSIFRGGSSITMDEYITNEEEDDETGTADAYTMLAKAIQSRFRADDDDAVEPDVERLVKAFR
jgi:hypothetical protein